MTLTMETLKDTVIILSGIVVIGSTVYWVLKSRLTEDFCTKKECAAKHESFERSFMSYKSGVSDDLKEIKDMVKEIRNWVVDFLAKPQ